MEKEFSRVKLLNAEESDVDCRPEMPDQGIGAENGLVQDLERTVDDYDAPRIEDLRKKLSVINHVDEVTPEANIESERNFYTQRLLELKEILVDPKLPQSLRDFLQEAEVVGAIVGIKPGSHVTINIDHSKPEYFTKSDIKLLEEKLNELGVLFKIPQLEDQIKAGAPYLEVDLNNVSSTLELISTSGLFLEEEVEFAKKNLRDFFSSGKMRKFWDVGLSGISYGYPQEDVRDFNRGNSLFEKYPDFREVLSKVKKLYDGNTSDERKALLREFKETLEDESERDLIDKMIKVKPGRIQGVKGCVGWKIYNPDSENVINFKRKLEMVFGLQEKLLKDLPNEGSVRRFFRRLFY
jgi:hypothetical protein